MPLFVVATPIGNLSDVSERAVEVLRAADLVACEDTRVTRVLMTHIGAKAPLTSLHQHVDDRVIRTVVEALKEGKNVALTSDAGTPGVNDPGGRLVEEAIRAIPDLVVSPIPGANAAISLLSVSGVPSDRFLFLGFPPHKKGRERYFDELTGFDGTVVFYESPHRLLKALEALVARAPDRHLVIGRELTKKFETIYRGTPTTLLEHFSREAPRGEFVCLLGPVK